MRTKVTCFLRVCGQRFHLGRRWCWGCRDKGQSQVWAEAFPSSVAIINPEGVELGSRLLEKKAWGSGLCWLCSLSVSKFSFSHQPPCPSGESAGARWTVSSQHVLEQGLSSPAMEFKDAGASNGRPCLPDATLGLSILYGQPLTSAPAIKPLVELGCNTSRTCVGRPCVMRCGLWWSGCRQRPGCSPSVAYVSAWNGCSHPVYAPF